MERPVMFVKSLLVLLMVIYVAYARLCEENGWEAFKSPQRTETAVLARVLGVQIVDADRCDTDEFHPPGYGRYNMLLEHIFKNGTTPLKLHNNTFVMIMPWSTPLQVNDCILVAGHVDGDGELYANECHLMKLSSELCSQEWAKKIIDYGK